MMTEPEPTPALTAENLHAYLTATAGELAKVMPEQEVTAPSPEMVDTVKLLLNLSRRATEFPEHCLRAIRGEVDPEEWSLLAGILAAASGACHARAREHQRDTPASDG